MTTELSTAPNTDRQHQGTVLPTVAELREELPLSQALKQRVESQREEVRRIMRGEDPRMMIVMGPCSLHDERSAVEYAGKLAELAEAVKGQFLLVMRAYVEKPRTTVGWKGMLYDPYLNGSDDMASGVRLSRALMLELLQQGVPLATELLHPMAAGYFSDLIAWAAIGARTTESQVHREMVSGLPMPVGFKNATDGSVFAAADAIRSANHPHHFLGLDDSGHPAMLNSEGNPDTHIVLRGGRSGPNYKAESVAEARQQLNQAGLNPSIMVDCSHGNSHKNPALQPVVFNSVLEQRTQGDTSLRSVMLESHLNDGAQKLGPSLKYGVSITDGCLSWEQTSELVQEGAEALKVSHQA